MIEECESLTFVALLSESFYDNLRSMDMDILLLQFCAVARENMEGVIFKRMAERFEVVRL